MRKIGDSDLLMLKRKAVALGLCGEYKGLWDSAQSQEELLRIALDANGIEFVADSIAFGWGLSKDYILKHFSDYINGEYTCRQNGYNSELFVGKEGDVTVSSTLNLFAYCGKLKINIPKNFVCKLYVCGGGDVSIDNCGDIELYVYGDCNVGVLNLRSTSHRMDIKKSSWV